VPSLSREEIRSFSYRPNPVVFALSTIGFGACLAVFIWKATTNDRGLILNGIIEFSEMGATTFYWVLAFVSFLFVAILLVSLLIGLFGKPKELKFTENYVIVPGGAIFNRQEKHVLYSDISNASEMDASGTMTVTLLTKSGKKVSFNNRMFKSKAEFEVARALVQKIVA